MAVWADKAPVTSSWRDKDDPNLVFNGDFANGTSYWTPFGGAELSVEDGIMEVVDASGVSSSAARQNIQLIAGVRYLTSCEARSVVGGSAQLLFEVDGDTNLQGTNSPTFTPLSFEFTALFTASYTLKLRESGATIGDIAEFKNVSVTEVI